MKFYGYYSIENVSHDRGYGEFEAESFETGFQFLWNEVVEIIKSSNKITECYLTHTDKSDINYKKFAKTTNYGWSLKNDMFRRNVVIEQMNTYYIWAEKPQ